MADKNINFNIKVNNKELDLTKTSFKEFDTIVKQAKKDLEALPLNSPAYKQLSTDINTAEKAWKAAKQEAANFGDEMDKGDAKVKSYSSQIRQAKTDLVSIEQQFGKNSAEYEKQAQKVKELSDAQEELNRGTQKLDDALSNIPGPIGRVGQAMQSLENIAGSAKSAMSSLGLGFKSFDQIIKTSLVGFLVGLLATLVAAVMEAAKSFKPLQDAFAALKDSVGAIFNALKPITDFLLNVFVGALKIVAGAINLVAQAFGGMNNGAAQASLVLERNIKKQESLLSNYGQAIDAKLKEIINAYKEFSEKKKKILDDDYQNEADRQGDIAILQLGYINFLKTNLAERKKLSSQFETDINKFEKESQVRRTDNQRQSDRLSSDLQKQYIGETTRNELNYQKAKMKALQDDEAVLRKLNTENSKETLKANISSQDLLRIEIAKIKTKGFEDFIAIDEEQSKKNRQYAREDVAIQKERYLQIIELNTNLIKEENARKVKDAKNQLERLKEQQRLEYEQAALAGQTTKGLKEKQAAELKLANEKIRLAGLELSAYEEQLEIDKWNRIVIEGEKGSKEYYQTRRDIATKEMDKETILADGDMNKIENARTEHWKKIYDIDTEELQNILSNLELQYSGMYDMTEESLNKLVEIENANYQLQRKQAEQNYDQLEALEKVHAKRLEMIEIQRMNARLDIMNTEMSGLYDGTVAAFEKMREIENQQYAIQQAEAKGNYDKLQALAVDHAKKLAMIDSTELQSKADIETRKAEAVGSIVTAHYDMLRQANDEQTQANIIAAGDNASLVEAIQLEHLRKEKEIGAAEIENTKTIQIAKLQIVADFGSLLNSVAEQLMSAAQGRNEQEFNNAKKLAVASIAIEKAAAIGQIIANTGIANAKAVAASPLTFGQPWVAINTVSAGLAVAATIAAGVQQISQINSTQFQSANTGGTEKKGGNNYGRNYEDGGIIGGNRHYAGGTMIEAEKGEAIMTRGAVTLFGPMLSMMNQAGGGTSFATNMMTTSFDNPKGSNPSNQSPQIIKTYVVENELTSEQHRQARLKDLSTI